MHLESPRARDRAALATACTLTILASAISAGYRTNAERILVPPEVARTCEDTFQAAMDKQLKCHDMCIRVTCVCLLLSCPALVSLAPHSIQGRIPSRALRAIQYSCGCRPISSPPSGAGCRGIDQSRRCRPISSPPTGVGCRGISISRT